jgi:phage nucleotide-binding protein
MRYLDEISTIPATDPDNALILGTAVHTGIEKGLEAAIQEYSFSYPVITDDHINEIIKLEDVIPKARSAIPKGGQFEVPIVGKDFIGFADYLVPVELTMEEKDDICYECEKADCPYESSGVCKYGKYDQVFDFYDFKYTKNPAAYKRSPQLSLYKYFFERYNPGMKIRNMYYLIIPKITIKQKKTETLSAFRDRLKQELETAEISKVKSEYDDSAIINFLLSIKAIYEEKEFEKSDSYLCRYCEYEEFCKKGFDYFMKLPENKRRNIEEVKKRVIWIYGAPFCGKTTFANGFPDPLMINTDGNIRYVDAPYIRIKDDVKVEGRMTKRTLAWENFKDTVTELEKKDNDFRTIVVDLLEDLYEHCRLYMYQQMGITHESDDSFRAWDKVRSEFLNTLKRLMNLDYENIILISHEDTSKDITKKGGDKITSIKPNLQDKVAVKVAGMVDVVARIVADGDTHTFCFKSNEVIFGGGRLKVNAKDIPLDVDALFAVYDEANKNAVSNSKPNAARTRRTTEGQPKEAADKANKPGNDEQTANDIQEEKAPEIAAETTTTEPQQEEPEKSDSPDGDGQARTEPPVAEEKPRRRRRARE